MTFDGNSPPVYRRSAVLNGGAPPIPNVLQTRDVVTVSCCVFSAFKCVLSTTPRISSESGGH